MAELSVNGMKASEVSNEMVALYLLASVAANEPDAGVNIRDGVPVISGKSKDWLLANYIDCLRSINSRSVKVGQ